MSEDKSILELYTEEQQRSVEKHIERFFGKFDTVLHEVISPDIHLDICIIEPAKERDYYTLVTLGMGAHEMNQPNKNDDDKTKKPRAELVITLPKRWKVKSNDEKWYWPIRWLKKLARLPITNSTWLGYGHTIEAGVPVANTEFLGFLTSYPYSFGEKSVVCELTEEDRVIFYQVLALYKSEMDYKLKHDAETLDDLFFNEMRVINPKRKPVV